MRIEFVEPYRPSRRMWVLALGPWALAAALWCVHLYLRVRIEQQRVVLQERDDEARRAARAPAAQAPPPPYLQDALEALKRAQQPEADALKELETVAVMGIQVQSIDVNPAASSVTVELEARDDDVLGDYLEQLNAGMPKPMWHIRQISSRSGTVTSGLGAPALARSVTIVREL